MKTVIECTLGATEQTVGGITYSFDRDAHARFVNEVNSVLHRSIFLNVTHYREVPLDPPPPEDDQEIPAFLSGQGGTGDDSDTEDDDDATDDDDSSSEGDGAGEGKGTGDDDGSNASDESNALDSDQQADKQPEQAPVAAPAKKATNKSK